MKNLFRTKLEVANGLTRRESARLAEQASKIWTYDKWIVTSESNGQRGWSVCVLNREIAEKFIEETELFELRVDNQLDG